MATTKTGSVSKTYGNLEGDGGYDFRLGSLSPMPKIPAGATLTSLTYDCKARRNSGASGNNGKVDVDAGGTIVSVISGMGRNTDYDPAPVELKNYARVYGDGTILFLNGSDELHIEVQHNIGLLGTSWWMITENVITAYYSLPVYTITVNASPATGGTITGGGNYDNNTTATLTATPATGYTFVRWNDGDKNATRTITVTGDATYTATFEKLKYTVTWKNHDGTTLETDNNVEYGTTPSYNGATPTKASTAQHIYTFSGWSPTVSAVTGDVTYTAQFTGTVRKYTVRWFNYDGTLLETDTDVPYGTKPTYNGATPTKPSDDYYTYGFAGWSPSIEESIQGDKDFTAQFAQVDRYYTVRWVNASAVQGVEGALLETDEVKFDTQPDYNGATPKHPKQDTDPALNYDFIGWSAKVTDPAKPDTELEKVKGNITYTAIYETTPKLYAITVILFDGQPNTDIYEYGTEITVESPEIVDFHQFIKWTDGNTDNPRIVQVTGEVTYQAIYERIPIPIKANLEQVTGCYIIPTTKTIVYVINGVVPTVEIGAKGDMQTIDGWSFLVSNSVPENGYPLQKLFINGIRVY